MGFSKGAFGDNVPPDKLVLASRSGDPLGSTTSATYAVVYVFSLPANTLGPNDALFIRVGGSCTASSSAKALRTQISTNADGATGAVSVGAVASIASSAGYAGSYALRNLSALNKQRLSINPFGSGFASTAGTAIDFGVQQYIAVALNAADGETITLQSVSIWIERGTV